MTGKKVSDFTGEVRNFFVRIYKRVCEEKRPLATIHRLGSFTERPLWERIILPVAENGELSRLYVVNTTASRSRKSAIFSRGRAAAACSSCNSCGTRTA